MLNSARPLCLRLLRQLHSFEQNGLNSRSVVCGSASFTSRDSVFRRNSLCEYHSISTSKDNRLTPQMRPKTPAVCTPDYFQAYPEQKYVPSRSQHDATSVGKTGFLSRILASTGFRSGRMKHQKGVLKVSGFNLYMCLTTFIDYDDFIDQLHLPDTLNSWFRVNELHMWMCLVRLAQEGADGLFMRNCFVEAMWEDMTNRAKALGDTSADSRRKSIGLLHTQFKAALLAFDEGLLGDDHVLAGSLWRVFFEMDCDNIVALEKLTSYVRRQVAFLDSQDSSVLLTSGLMNFLELNRETEDRERSREKMLLVTNMIES